MKISSCKAKGRRLAQFTKDLILKKFPSLSDSDINVVPSSVPGDDLWLSPLAKAKMPFAFECKNTERASIWDWIKQTEKRKSELTPLIVFSRNRSKTYAVIEFERLLDVLFSEGDSYANRQEKTCDETAKAETSDEKSANAS